MKHEGSTIVAMHGKIGTLAATSLKARRRPKRARRAAISMRRASPYLKPTKGVPEPFREPRTDDVKIERDPQPHPEMIDARTVPARRPEFVGHR